MSGKTIRQSPSGRALQPLPGKGTLAWNGSALSVVILPAGHAEGLYIVEITAFCTALGVGTYTSALTWDQKGFGAASLAFGSVNLNATGLTFTVDRSIYSTGLSPIVWTPSPVGVSGSPNVNVLASAQLVALPI